MTAEDAVRGQIEEVVNRETRAWGAQDVELLSVFHEDMVWPWPPGPAAHDPLTWAMPLGRFDRGRWAAAYANLFGTYRLVHNRRAIRRIEVSAEGDGAFAVVDVDTLWRPPAGEEMHWQGRACKVYRLVRGEWKLTMHTGCSTTERENSPFGRAGGYLAPTGVLLPSALRRTIPPIVPASSGARVRASHRPGQTTEPYFSPEVLIDSTSCRWKIKKRSIVGIATTVEAAMM